MGRNPKLVRIVPAVMTAAAVLGACDDAAAPEPDPMVRVHVAHLAPGAGAYEVRVNSTTVAESLTAGNAVVDSVEPGEQRVVVEGPNSTFEVEERLTTEALGVALWGPPGAVELWSNVNAGVGGGPRTVLFNAVPGETVEVLFDLQGSRLRVGVASGEFVQLDRSTGEVIVSAYRADSRNDVVWGPRKLDLAEGSFVAVSPNPGGPEEWSVTLF